MLQALEVLPYLFGFVALIFNLISLMYVQYIYIKFPIEAR